MLAQDLEIQHIDLNINEAINLARPQQAFYVILVIHHEHVPTVWRDQCCEWIVQTQCCLQVMAWGTDCSIWHDVLDEFYLEFYNFQPHGNTGFITTWHENETLEDVMEFAQVGIKLQDESVSLLMVLHIK